KNFDWFRPTPGAGLLLHWLKKGFQLMRFKLESLLIMWLTRNWFDRWLVDWPEKSLMVQMRSWSCLSTDKFQHIAEAPFGFSTSFSSMMVTSIAIHAQHRR